MAGTPQPETRLKTFYLGDEQVPLEPFFNAYRPERRLTYVPVTLKASELGAGVENVIKRKVEAMNGTCTNNEYLVKIIQVHSKYNSRIGNTKLGAYGLEYNVTIEALCGDMRENTILFGCDFVSHEQIGIKLNFQKFASIMIPQDLVPDGFTCPNKVNVRLTNSGFLRYGDNSMSLMGKLYYYPKYSPVVRLTQMPSAQPPGVLETVFESTEVRPQLRDLLPEALPDAEPEMIELYLTLCNAAPDTDPKERTLEELAARVGVQDGVVVLTEIPIATTKSDGSQALLRRSREARLLVYDGEDHNEELLATILCMASGPQTCAIRINNISNPATIDLITILFVKYSVIGVYTPAFGDHFDGSAYLMATSMRPGISGTAAEIALRDAAKAFPPKAKKYWTTALHERHRPSEEFYNMALERHNRVVGSYLDVARSLHETYGTDLKKPGLEHIIRAYEAAQLEMKPTNPPIRWST
jgi:hypothetical protein